MYTTNIDCEITQKGKNDLDNRGSEKRKCTFCSVRVYENFVICKCVI